MIDLRSSYLYMCSQYGLLLLFEWRQRVNLQPCRRISSHVTARWWRHAITWRSTAAASVHVLYWHVVIAGTGARRQSTVECLWRGPRRGRRTVPTIRSRRRRSLQWWSGDTAVTVVVIGGVPFAGGRRNEFWNSASTHPDLC